MKVKTIRTGMAVAIAAASVIGCATDPGSPTREARVECHGVNECRGQSDCGAGRSSCGGDNACRGEGFKLMSQQDCESARAKFKSKPAKS